MYDSSPTLIVYNNNGLINPNLFNFHLRMNLQPGIYYVVVENADYVSTGDYTLHAEAVTDPGNTTATAKFLNLNLATGGTIGSANDTDYFRIDLSANTNLIIYARGIILHDGSEFFPLAPIVGQILDSSSNEVSVNITAGFFSFVIGDDFGPGTYYIRVTTPPGVVSHPVPYTVHAQVDTYYTDFINNCENAYRPSGIDDPLYGCQWHLNNSLGEDINVEPVWSEGLKGEGINIAVVDDGMDWSHEDLVDNVDSSLSHDYTGNNDIHHRFQHHGTNVAGIISARDNGVGVRGVAPQANIYGYNLLATGSRSDTDDANAMALNRVITAISNNSWGPPDGPTIDTAGTFWEGAVQTGVRDGYNGKGTFYAWAAGNGHEEGDNSNLDELANFYAVTAVCAVNDEDTRSNYSEEGANLWICAPSNDHRAEHKGIVTVENSNRYMDDFGGTSAATPIVSGVAALMRQANPNLTWRDLKLILAASARKNEPTNTGWVGGAPKYGSTSATDLYHFNHEYGFGVVDAKAAVDMAREWSSSLPVLQASSAASGNFNFQVPDLPAAGPPTTHYHDLTLNTEINFTEFVEVEVTFNHPSFRDLDIELVSPTGAVSKLTVPFDTYTPNDPTDDDFIRLDGTFRFGSARHLGENPNGAWRINVSDHIELGSGTWDSWSIKAYGHSGAPASASQCATGGAVANASNNHGLVLDCETLLTARDTLEGTGTSLNWSASTPMSAWDGITVEGTPARVTELLLWQRGLKGTIPEELGGLAALIRLSLSTSYQICENSVCHDTPENERNQLTGEIPSSLGSLAKLERLALSRNQLSGPIPAELANLTSLSQLELGGNQLAGPVPAWLGDLTNLTEVYLWGNEFTGLIPTELANLTSLTQLELAGNQLQGNIPVVVGDLTALERLTLHSNELAGTIPTELGGLPNLKVVSLWDNQLSGAIPPQLGNLSNLKVLSLWDNQLSGAIPPQLGNLSGLETLSLSQNQLSGTIPAELGDLSNLTVLSLWSNQLSGAIPPQLGNLTGLETLSLSQNQLSGTIPAELGDLSNLTVLSLWSNQLSGAIPASLVRLASLETLHLSQNQFVGCVPPGLQSVPTNDLAELALPFCVQPSVTLGKTSPDAPVRLDSLIQVTATFSEPVTGFEMADVVVANGLVSSFVGSDGDSVFTFDVIPNAIGVVTVDVSQDAAVDSEGNGNTASAQLRLGMPYDDDNDGNINGIEVLNGVSDYFFGILNAQQVLQLVGLYFSSPG